MKSPIDPVERLRQIVDAASQVEVAKQFGVAPSYISDVLRGQKEPGPALLDGMGLEKHIIYREKH